MLRKNNEFQVGQSKEKDPSIDGFVYPKKRFLSFVEVNSTFVYSTVQYSKNIPMTFLEHFKNENSWDGMAA